MDELNRSCSDEELQVFDDDNEEAELSAETVLNSTNNSDEIGVSETNQLGKEDEFLINREISMDINSDVNEVSQGGADVLIFSETLVSRLDVKKIKGKPKTKWSGTLRELQDFVVLMLNLEGRWKSKTQGGVETYVFEQNNTKLKITWWSSTGTLTVQGESKLCSKVTKTINQLLESKIDKGTASDFQGKSTIEEESTVNVMKTKRRRLPNKSSSEAPLRELKAYVKNEMKKVWEALESLTKELSKPSKSKKDKDTGPVTKVATSNPVQPLATNLLSTVATSNCFEHLTADSTGIEFNQQETTKATKASSKDVDQVKIKAFEKKISELEYQIQTRESIIKNLSSANERLFLENTDLRKKINSDQVTSKKAKNCTGGIQSNTAKNDSRSNQGKGKPSIFIAGDSMIRDLKGWHV